LQTRYIPNAEQVALAGTIEESLAPLLPLSRVHASPVESAAIWASLPEERGGSGLGAVEEALIVLALGQRLVAPAVLATIGAAPRLPGVNITSPSGDSAVEPGARCVAAAYRRGGRTIVVEDCAADLVLVRDGASAGLYDLSACASHPLEDRLWLDGLRELVGLGEPVARFEAFGLLRLRLIDAAALSGISQAALEMSVAYAGTRAQFGRPIGSFQAIKHHCANMAMSARRARDQTCFAAVAVDERRDDAALQVECALYVAGQAALDNAGRNIQIHGGIGFSDEADPHLLLKRAQLLITVAGGLEAANERIADIQWGG